MTNNKKLCRRVNLDNLYSSTHKQNNIKPNCKEVFKKMNTEERKQEILKRFGKLEEENKLITGRVKSVSFGSSNVLNSAREIIKSHLVDGITEIPISYKEYSNDLNCSNIQDFNHFRDKMTRIFEIAIITELNLVDPKEFSGLYKSENTKLIREHLIRNKHLSLVSNTEDKTDLFLKINVSDIISPESE